MGSDNSRLYPSSAEESYDAYISRGGARLVERDRSFTTSTTIEIGFAGDCSVTEEVGQGVPQQQGPWLQPRDTSFLKIMRITLEAFQKVVMSCENDQQLISRLESDYSLQKSFISQSLRRAVASKKLDLLMHALSINSVLPPDSSVHVEDSTILQLLQKAVTLEDPETFAVMLPYVGQPSSSRTVTELQSLAILAAQFGSLECVRHLCRRYPVCLEQTVQGRSVFIEVARMTDGQKQTLVLSDLLELGVYVNTQEPDGSTALHIAVGRGSVENARLFLRHGACTGLPNARRERPLDLVGENEELSSLLKEASPLPHEASLYLAAESGDIESMKKLLQLPGVSVNSRWIHGRTALCAVARTGNAELMAFLLGMGARAISSINLWPEIPIAHALVHGHTALALSLMENMEGLFQSGTEHERKAMWEELVTVLHYCCQVGAVEVAEALLGAGGCGVRSDAARHCQLLPMHTACKHGQLPVVKMLLRHGADPCSLTQVYCNSPLHYSCFYGHTCVSEHLLRLPAVSVECTNAHHETPLYCVLRRQLTPNEKCSFIREKSVIFLLSHGAKLTKPGRHLCELNEFTLEHASQRWAFVPTQTQKLIMVLRNEGRNCSLMSEVRLAIRGHLETEVNEDVVSEVGLPFRLQRYLLLKDWYP